MKQEPTQEEIMTAMASRQKSMEVIWKTITIHDEAITQLRKRLKELDDLQKLDEYLLKELYNGTNE